MDLNTLADACGTDKGAHQGFMKYYERYLPPRDKPINLVELGVYEGASMKLWHSYFTNPWSNIIGVDRDLSPVQTKRLLTHRSYEFRYMEELGNGQLVLEGDQAEEGLAEAVRTLVGEFAVVVDDASHYSSKTIASFEIWWPKVVPGGLYVVEDTHTSYDTFHYGDESGKPNSINPRFAVTPRRTTMEYLKRLADDVNWNYHGFDRFQPLHQDIAWVHFYPGIAFIGKKTA